MSDKILKLRRQFWDGMMTAQEYFDEVNGELRFIGRQEILAWFLDEVERLVDLNCYFDTRYKIEVPLQALKDLQFNMVENWIKGDR